MIILSMLVIFGVIVLSEIRDRGLKKEIDMLRLELLEKQLLIDKMNYSLELVSNRVDDKDVKEMIRMIIEMDK